MVQNMRDYCLYDDNKLDSYLRKFNLRKLMEDVTEIIKDQSKQRNIWVKLIIGEDIPTLVTSDSKRLKQIFLNLLSISAKYTFNGKIILSATYEHPLISFAIKDTGMGRPNEETENLLKFFEDSPDLPSGNEKISLGLGLTLSQILVKRIGTRISFTTSENFGSQFSFGIFNNFQETQSETSMGLYSPRKSIPISQKGFEMFNKIRKVKSRGDIRPTADQSGNNIIDIISRQSSLSSGMDKYSIGESEPQLIGRSVSSYRLVMKNAFSFPFIADTLPNICNCPDVLVVDDTSINLEVLQNIIKKLGLECDVVI
jgi:hypothetical protein